MAMHKLARQKHILDRLSETGQLSISELVADLQVSADTIRRDLSDLEQQGVLQKSHGGAIGQKRSSHPDQAAPGSAGRRAHSLWLDAVSRRRKHAAGGGSPAERAVNRDHGFSGYRSAVQRPCRYPADPAWRPVG